LRRGANAANIYWWELFSQALNPNWI
jgi:hypothetical protein